MATLTNFEKVTQFNQNLGQGVETKPNIPSLAQCNLRLSLIKEEAITELLDALVARDLVAVADAIGDALVVVYGAANDCGLDADAIFDIVHQSNMSKLCDNEEDAQYAVSRYQSGDGFHGKTEPINAAYRPAPLEGKFIVFNQDTNKTLKGPSFSEPTSELEKLIYPNGKDIDPNASLRQASLNQFVNEEITIEEYWDYNTKLDQEL